MNNLITVFMNYKLSRLTEYGVFFFGEDTSFVRDVFHTYFQTYIDNYYYDLFHTIDEENANRKNLKLEFSGIMEEMLYEYRAYELKVSREEYEENCKKIRTLRELSYEIVRLDQLEISTKEEIDEKVLSLIEGNEVLSKYHSGNTSITKLVRDTFLTSSKLLDYSFSFYTLEEVPFLKREDAVWMRVIPNIKSLEVYRSNLVHSIFDQEEFIEKKVEVEIQMISLLLLKNLLSGKENKKIFMELPDYFIHRGKIDEKILSLIDNPLFQKYVYLGVSYSTYSSQRSAFLVDYHFALIQDFRYIQDVYQKVNSMIQEGFSHYLIVKDCKWDDRDFFINYKNDVFQILLFKEGN